MDLSQYAELFLAESREHLGACNQWLLQWERDPAAAEPVGGLFRAVHTIKGMAATMGYASVADLAHSMENLLDHLRRGPTVPPADVFQVLFRATDALERAIGRATAGGDADPEDAAVMAALNGAVSRMGAAVETRGPGRGRGGRRARSERRGRAAAEPAAVHAARAPPAAPEPGPRAGRLVTVGLRPEAPLKGGRALLVLRRAEALGQVWDVTPPVAAFELEEFDGRFSFRIQAAATAAAVDAALRAAGDVDSVLVGEEDARAPRLEPVLGEAGRSRHIRVDLRRLDALMDLIGELVTARGRLNELAGQRRDPALDDLAVGVSRLTADLQAEIIQARMTPLWQVFDRFTRLVRDSAH
ncbi:MAG TPA: Hpt domain-containing protein, partial [Methylomirabilota bacterium]|nr:Hpt domain-containing protein [Methylomirabilota bacterium]